MNLLNLIQDSGKVFIVAVAGDSGSGKTTFTNAIRRILGEKMVSSFTLDDYHSLDRVQRKELGITPLDPRANHFDLLTSHLEALRRGETIDKPVYDHKLGTISGTVPFAPTPVIIIEGLHPFYTEPLRRLTDFKVFVDPSRSVKRRWKLKRDVVDRGYKPEDVISEILVREPDYKLYVDIQKIYAEMVIKIQESRFHNPWADERAVERYSVRLIQQMLDLSDGRVSMTIDLGNIMRVSEHEFSIEFQRDDYYGKRVGVMTIDGEIHHSMVEDLEEKLCEMLGVPSCCNQTPTDYLNATDLSQLILCWRCLEKIATLVSGQKS